MTWLLFELFNLHLNLCSLDVLAHKLKCLKWVCCENLYFVVHWVSSCGKQYVRSNPCLLHFMLLGEKFMKVKSI